MDGPEQGARLTADRAQAALALDDVPPAALGEHGVPLEVGRAALGALALDVLARHEDVPFLGTRVGLHLPLSFTRMAPHACCRAACTASTGRNARPGGSSGPLRLGEDAAQEDVDEAVGDRHRAGAPARVQPLVGVVDHPQEAAHRGALVEAGAEDARLGAAADAGGDDLLELLAGPPDVPPLGRVLDEAPFVQEDRDLVAVVRDVLGERLAAGGDLAGALEQRLDEARVDPDQQLLLAADVVVETAALQAGGRAEVVDRRRVVAALREHARGDVDDLVAALLEAPRGAGARAVDSLRRHLYRLDSTK